VNGFAIGAWREILARVFEGFQARDEYSPDWLINPKTGRRLKLDRYYAELGIAFRFVGLKGQQNYRLSDEEAQQETDRNAARDELCRQQGVALVQIDPDDPEPWLIVGRIRSALSRTARHLAQSATVDGRLKRDLAQRLARAQKTCDEIQAQVRKPDGLKLFADLGQDRMYAPSGVASAALPKAGRRYMPGMVVEHLTFGRGVVQEVRPAAGDETVVVLFDDGTERKFLASLCRDKLLPAV
jgi:hypothetical protein